VPLKDALVVERLRKEGAIVLAKTNMAELAMYNMDSEMGGLCKNPFDLSRTCGGSSTGTGAAISAGLGVIGLGTDTEGSIINPSSFNGIFGLRPSMNEPPVEGIVPLFERRDTVGPMTKYVVDLALVYSIMNDDQSFYEKFMVCVNFFCCVLHWTFHTYI
jgi:Asp-tRNA(Asn)/Glu-tRNA(Gln) amidotransferase A subunit family amidase